MKKTKVVRFITGFDRYNKGELARFSEDRALALIKAGVAENYYQKPRGKKVKADEESGDGE